MKLQPENVRESSLNSQVQPKQTPGIMARAFIYHIRDEPVVFQLLSNMKITRLWSS